MFWNPNLRVRRSKVSNKPIGKVYIDGLCGSRTVAVVLRERFKRVGHVINFYKKNMIPMRDPLSVWLGPRV